MDDRAALLTRISVKAGTKVRILHPPLWRRDDVLVVQRQNTALIMRRRRFDSSPAHEGEL